MAAPPLSDWKPRLAAKARLRWDKVDERYMLVFPEAALMLNPTAAEVLKLCDGQRSVADIIAGLDERFKDADRAQIADHVHELLTRIHARGLLETGLDDATPRESEPT